MAYSPTIYVNGTTPAINATDLNKLTNELKQQAIDKGITNSLPTWTNGVAPAVSDPVPLNEMERVTQAVATSLSLSYTPTVWSSGWSPARNATNLNKLENQAAANRNVITPPTGTLYDAFSDFVGYPNARFFLNRLKPPSTDIYEDFAGNAPAGQTNWPSNGGAAVREVVTPYGGGFQFLCNPEMVDPGQGSLVKRCEIDMALNADKMCFTGGVGSTDIYTFKVMLPLAGNASGFSGLTRNNIFFGFHDGGANWTAGCPGGCPRLPLSVGIDCATGATTPRFFVAVGLNGNLSPIELGSWHGPPASGGNPNGYLIRDTWYDFRLEFTWSPTAGHFNWFLDGVQIANYSGQTMASGDSAWFKMGYYSFNTDINFNPFNVNNELRMGGLTRS